MRPFTAPTSFFSDTVSLEAEAVATPVLDAFTISGVGKTLVALVAVGPVEREGVFTALGAEESSPEPSTLIGGGGGGRAVAEEGDEGGASTAATLTEADRMRKVLRDSMGLRAGEMSAGAVLEAAEVVFIDIPRDKSMLLPLLVLLLLLVVMILVVWSRAVK